MSDKRGRGRPTKYNNEMVQKAEDYLTEWQESGDVIPTIEGLALHLSIARDTIYDWSDQQEKENFSDIVRKILSTQSKILINMGLMGEFNSSITKLMLTKFGYSDKVDTDITTKGKEVSNNFVITPVVKK